MKNLTLTRALTLAILAGALGACATPIQKYERSGTPLASEQGAQRQMTDVWNSLAVQKEGHATVILSGPKGLPAELKSRQLKMSLESGAAIKDVVAVLAELGHNVVLSDEEVGNRKIFMPKFNGKLGNFLSNVGKAADVWFTYQNGTIHVSSKERVTLTLPQEESLAKKVTEGLNSLKIEGATVSWTAGLVSLDLSPSEFRRTRVFLERISANASMVTLQVAIVNVTMNQDSKQGIDWDKLQLAVSAGSPAGRLYETQPAAGTGTGTGTGSGTSTNTNTSNIGGAATPTAGTPDLTNFLTGASNAVVGGALNGALGGVAIGSRFVFSGLFNYLQTYGETETKQNVVLKTVAGSEVKLESVTQIPYVEDIGVTTTGGNSNGGSSALGSARTAKANDGLTLSMTPSYDASANTVTVTMDLAIEAVVAFNNLSAGNQLGQLTQPTTAKRAFNDTLRVRPGQTVVVGGLTYDSVSDNKGGPIALKDSRWESQTVKVSRQSMFIVIRPTVATLGTIVEGDVPGWEPESDYEAPAQDAPKARKGGKE